MRSKPVLPFWHGNLEPSTFSGQAVFGDLYFPRSTGSLGTGTIQTRCFSKTPGKESFFIFRGYPRSIILADQFKSGTRIPVTTHGCNSSCYHHT